MCGIYGFFHLDSSRRADPAILGPMGRSLAHRGPDDSGERTDGCMAMGHRRLSILDLSPSGREPMTNEDQTLWLVFNGEIYNYRDFVPDLIRRGHRFTSQTDCEVLLHLYEEEGIRCLEKLNGMFALMLWDKKNGSVFLVRDRMGVKPLHYTVTGDTLIFGSELKAILAHPEVSRRVDRTALADYLAYEYVPAPKTIFEGIRKLQPAHYLQIRGKEIRETCYWSPHEIQIEHGRSEESFAEELQSRLRESVRKRLVSDVPVGAFLSGGVDSSSVAAFMQEFMPGKVQTFTIGFEEDSFDESKWAALAARHLGTDHHIEKLSVSKMLELVPRVMDYLDEPFGDASFFPTLLLSRFTRRRVTVSLSGDGADELFAGYPTYPSHAWADRYRLLPAVLRAPIAAGIRALPVSHRNLSLDFKLKQFLQGALENSPARRHYTWMGSFSAAARHQLLSPAVRDSLRGYDPYLMAEEQFELMKNRSDVEKILACDQRFYLQDNMLVKLDRASMAASLEARDPFLDHELVEFSWKIPFSMKARGWNGKWILKKAMASKLPTEILERPKKGFGIPLASWFQNELKPLLMEKFEPSKLRREGFFDPEVIQKLMKEHFSLVQDHRKKLYTLLNFELWLEKYL